MTIRARTVRTRARATLLGCMLAGATACQPGHGGTLEPAAEQGTGPGGPLGGTSVAMVADRLAIQLSGRWRNTGTVNSFVLDATYRNTGDRPVVLDAATFGVERERDRGAVLQVVDMTGVNMADDRTDNDDPLQVINLFENRKAGTITLVPGERRIVTISAYLINGALPIDDDQTIAVTVPGVRGVRQAVFVTGSGWL